MHLEHNKFWNHVTTFLHLSEIQAVQQKTKHSKQLELRMHMIFFDSLNTNQSHADVKMKSVGFQKKPSFVSQNTYSTEKAASTTCRFGLTQAVSHLIDMHSSWHKKFSCHDVSPVRRQLCNVEVRG